MLNKLFKKPDDGSIIDKGMKAIDKIAFTKQEKAEYHKNIIGAHTDFVKAQMNANTTSSKARRWIALMVISLFVLYSIAYGICVLTNSQDKANKLLQFMLEILATPMLMVTAFYYGGYFASQHLSSIITPKRRK